ncbi:MAG: type II toxin-antitoxin system RelE/ParE family toxin [Actinomycetota bacterium]
MKSYSLELSPSAVRIWKKLPTETRVRLRKALEKLAKDAATPGRIGGKSVKTIRGVSDSFHRLRSGDYRVIFDVIDEDRVILVLGIVHRRDLERWLRSR